MPTWKEWPLDESDLVTRARQGDTAAYEILVRAYQDLVLRTAYVITHDAAAAEDAAQETFVKAFYALPRFRAGSPLRPWLLRIAGNEARNRRLADSRRAALALRSAAGDPRASVPSPESAVLAAEQRESLLNAVNQLPLEDREVIACRYFLALSEAEMATALDCPRGTVKSRLSRALKRLRLRIERAEGVDLAGSAGGRSTPHG